MASIEADLKEVLDNYKKKLTPEEEKKFASTTLKDLKDAITGLQDDQRKSKTVRNLAKMQKFLSCMSQYQTIIEVFLNTSDILCFVWGPLKFLLLVSFLRRGSYDMGLCCTDQSLDCKKFEHRI